MQILFLNLLRTNHDFECLKSSYLFDVICSNLPNLEQIVFHVFFIFFKIRFVLPRTN